MEKCPPEEESEDSKMDSFLDMRLTEDLDSLIQNAFEKLNSSPDDQVYSFLPLQDVNSFSDPSAFINSDSNNTTPILSTQNMDLNNENLENPASALCSNSLTSRSVSDESKSFTKDNTLALEDSLLTSSLNVANDAMASCSSQIQKEILESECAETQFSQDPVDVDAGEPQAPLNLTVQNPGLGLLSTGGDQKSISVPDVFVPSEEFSFQPHKHTELPPKGKDVNFCPVLTPLPLLLPPPPPPPMWNPMIPAFDLFQGNHGFVAPVVTTAAHWRPVNYTFPSPVISHTSPTKVWRNKEGTSAYQVQETPVSQVVRKKTSSYIGLVLVLLRGLPGSGKSFLASKFIAIYKASSTFEDLLNIKVLADLEVPFALDLRDNEDITSEKEENVLSLSLKHLELTEEKKLEEFPDTWFSDSESKVRVTDKSEKEEQVKMASDKECSKTSADSSEEGVSPGTCYGENSQEDCDLSNTVPPQNEKSPPGEMWEERATVKKKAFGKQKSKSTLEKFPRHELSFVGDWPVDKTIGQRTKRNRKTEKASSVQSDKKYNRPQSRKVVDSSLSVSIDCIQQQGSPHENVEDDKSQCDDASESFNSSKYDPYKNTEKDSFNIVGDWPSSDSLAQREHRSRMPKASLSEPHLEFGTNSSMNEISLYTAHEACWGTSPEELKTLGSNSLGSSEMLSNEMSHENKSCPGKQIHTQHTLPLTYSNNVPTVPGGVGPQPSAEFPEEKCKEVPGIGVGVCTQTEPQDFALLWKIEKNKISVSDSLRVLTGRLDGFKPKAFSINTKLDVQDTIPYRVMYDKSTYVEESELTSADESENLNILCKLFGSFSLEALKDLYERCNKDIIWATSLLLDSETKLCEETEFENIQKSYDAAQIGPFSLGLNLKEIISQRGTLEDSSSSVPEFSHGIGISNTNVQSSRSSEKENSEQAEMRAITTEKPGLITSIFPNATVDLKNTNEVLPNSQAELSGLCSIKQFFPGTLKATTIKNVNEMEKHPEVTEVGDSIHSSLNLSDILNSGSNTSNLELHEETYFTDSLEINKNENLPKDYVKFPNTEEFMNEDEREMEKILMAGNTLSAEVTEEDKTEMLTSTPTMARSLTIDCLELALPPELAFQLSELFGPVGIDSGATKTGRGILWQVNASYSLEHTVQFLNCVLDGDPVRTVVAQEFVHQNENVASHAAQKSKEKKVKKLKETEDTPNEPSFQDFEYPEYDDYRAEAFLHQQKRMECYSKAKEAYRMGKKNVATFYAQQGSLHEQKMKEANHLAAVEIFEKVNASLLPQNVLDLHGLHVDEAIEHLTTVLQQKTEEFKQNSGKPYLSVITGRGNHSQGGVARIKPAVIKYLTSHSFSLFPAFGKALHNEGPEPAIIVLVYCGPIPAARKWTGK
ncbi:NEDD4-binding protein 2 [Camelus ferus]|nr:NEDD4-binding protein 2 [Camelus ferus]